ncbi:MAG: hypothetical protein C0622_12810 [Desulfuromonas sp.]|nr:MAG: hypothetical protein C0622_12810 [Desulfuromonas sp.]
MKKILFYLTIVAFLFTCNVSIAAPVTANTVEKILNLSGINKQLTELPKMIKHGLDQARQQNPSITESDLAGMKKVIDEAFIPDEFIHAIGSEISANLSENEANQLVTWFESSMGREITSAEVEATTPGAFQNMLAEAQTLFSDTTRVSIVQKIDNLLGATDMSVQIQLDTAIAVFTSLTSSLGETQGALVETFKAQLEAQKEQMRKNTEQLTLLTFLYYYKDIDPKTLNEYVNFLGNPNTLKFSDCVKTGTKTAFDKSTKTMAKSLDTLFSNQNS